MDQQITLNRKDVVQLAKMVAAQSIAAMRDEITGVVEWEMPRVLASEEAEKKLLSDAPRRYGFLYTEPPPPPASNYTKVLMASAKWRSGKGACLGMQVMCKPTSFERLIVEQYKDACSVMRKDITQPKAKFDSVNKMVEPGMSIWTQFEEVKGTLEDVVAKLIDKGWEIYQTSPPKSQLSLVDG